MLWNSKIINNVLTTHSARVDYVGHLASVKLALTVEEDIKFWMQLNNYSDQETMEIALEHFGLLHQRSMPVRFLSSGQQRKLALTRLMVRDSKIWLLDEPTVGLDSKSIQSLEDIIQKQRADNGIVVVASHTEIRLGNSIKNINLSNFQTNNTQAYSPGFGYEE
jgi:heme exporter protein A